MKGEKNEKQQRAEHAERAEQTVAKQSYAEQVGRKHGKDEQQNEQSVQVKKRKAKPMRSPYDVNGSYTGTPSEGEKPVQDADDL